VENVIDSSFNPIWVQECIGTPRKNLSAHPHNRFILNIFLPFLVFSANFFRKFVTFPALISATQTTPPN
jgi:hypothetical protein